MLSSAHNKGSQARKMSTVNDDVGQAAHSNTLPNMAANKKRNRNMNDLAVDEALTGNICVKIAVFAEVGLVARNNDYLILVYCLPLQ